MDSMNRYLPLPVSWIFMDHRTLHVFFWGKPLTGGIWRLYIPMIRDHCIYPIVVYIQYLGHNTVYHIIIGNIYIHFSIIGFILSYIYIHISYPTKIAISLHLGLSNYDTYPMEGCSLPITMDHSQVFTIESPTQKFSTKNPTQMLKNYHPVSIFWGLGTVPWAMELRVFIMTYKHKIIISGVKIFIPNWLIIDRSMT